MTNVLERISFDGAKAIGPRDIDAWPGQRTTSLYWVARKQVLLPGAADGASLLIAADRHYELYVNGVRVLRQRNFYCGDQYIFAQRWADQLAGHLKAGTNRIDVLVRSDPWRNKNHRCFWPMLLLEGSIQCGSARITINTDESWETAMVQGWREQIAMAACDTIHRAKVVLPPKDEAILAGFSDHLAFGRAARVESPLPDIYLWDDPPKRIDIRSPENMVASGTCVLPDRAIALGLRPIMDKAEEPIVLEASFDSPGKGRLSLATSALADHRIELNGQVVYEAQNCPSRHQMGLPEYLVPAGHAEPREGINTLRIVIDQWPKHWSVYRLAVMGAPALFDSAVWHGPFPPDVKVEPLELSEQIGAKVVTGDGASVVGSDSSLVVLSAQTSRQDFAVLDLGGVYTGRLRMRFTSESAGRLLIAYGFTCEDGVVDCQRMHLRSVDVLELPAGESCYEAFDVTTCRYVDLIFEGFRGRVEVADIQVEEATYLDESGSDFQTSDSLVDQVWRASRRTAQLCGIELFMDNPEREHAQWVDCTVATAACGYYVFGEQRKVAKALTEFSWTQQPDGQIAGYCPGKWFPRLPLQCHMSLFCIGCHRHFMHTGDEKLANHTLDVIIKMIEHWERHRTRKGLIANLHAMFVDWGSHIYSYARRSEGPNGALTAMNGYYLGVLKVALDMAERLGRVDAAQGLADITAEVIASMREQLYDASLGLFRDGAGDDEAEGNYSQTANSLAVQYGAAPPGEEKAILTRAFEPSEDLKMIPANAHFARQAGAALFEAGCDELALRWLRDGFGKMLSVGPGTLWESWQPHASQCQATGAAPAYLFCRYLAGVYPAEPGYKTIGIDPHPSGLSQLSATLCTPVGRVGVDWRAVNGRLDYQLRLPPALRDRPVQKPPSVELSIAAMA